MTNITYRKPTVIQDSRRQITALFQLDIPKEHSEISLKHPDLWGKIEGFIQYAYEIIPTLNTQNPFRSLIQCWKIDPTEYTQAVMNLIQTRRRDTEEIRYIISFSQNLEINHNLQLIDSEGNSALASIYIPGYSVKSSVQSSFNSTKQISTLQFNMNLDMSVSKDRITDSVKFHAKSINTSLQSFANEVDFWSLEQAKKIGRTYQKRQEKAGLTDSEIDVWQMPICILNVEDVYRAVMTASELILEDRLKNPESNEISNVYITTTIDTQFIDDKPDIQVKTEVKTSHFKTNSESSTEWEYKTIWTSCPTILTNVSDPVSQTESVSDISTTESEQQQES